MILPNSIKFMLKFYFRKVIFIGFIYQIKNVINNKKYIGMTTRSVEIRKKDHLKFSIIEECDNDKLEEKEKYYIRLFNTISEGYNEALGGKGKPLWTDKQIEACKTLYENGWLLQDISDVFKSSPRTIGKKLREKYKIDTKLNSISSFSKPVIGVSKNKDIIEFSSLSDAARYLSENHITNNKNLISIISKIEESLHNENRSAYGYKWKYKTA